jgi:cytoskeletal protein RodZ
MDKAGDLLRQQRLKLKLTFTAAAQMTKIPANTLQALEKNQYHQLPGPTYIKGFIQNYATFLKLDPGPVLAVFRRDYDKVMQKKILPTGLTKPLNIGVSQLINKNLLALIVVVGIVATYLGFAIFKLYQPPALTISQPQNGVETTSPVLIKGKSVHDATVTLNGKTINLESDGSFTTVYQGQVGTATLTFVSKSRRGKTTTLERHVIILR